MDVGTDARPDADTSVAVVLVVLGCGLRPGGGRWELSAAALARVAAAVDHVARHADRFTADDPARVVFSGGWSRTGVAPPVGFREGDLMLAAARAAGLGDRAEMFTETRSRSTAGNLAHTRDDGLLDRYTFTAAQPLGLVTHDWHLPRARRLAGRILALPPASLVGIPAAGGDRSRDRARERVLGAGGWLYPPARGYRRA